MKPRIFIAQPPVRVAIDILREVADVTVYQYLDRQITADELAANAQRADWLMLVSDNIITKEIIDGAPGLKGIGTVSTRGLYIDIPAATARKVAVVTSDPAEFEGPDASVAVRGGVSLATADLTMGMLIGLAYRMVEADRFTRAGHFKQEQTLALNGIGCPGKTVGLIGLGKVARFMVPRLHAFDMHILYMKRTRLAINEEKALGLEWAGSLDELLTRSDFVCIECDYNESTHKLIGERELRLMRPTAYLINTARGRIVDELALIRALQDGTISGAALDVYWNEPPVTYDPYVPAELCKLDNVILNPHNGGATGEVRGARAASVARAIVTMLKGGRASGLLNPEIYATD
jgi:lactate dehydrogenase-like 2-hydroxyacid dehydrogenase